LSGRVVSSEGSRVLQPDMNALRAELEAMMISAGVEPATGEDPGSGTPDAETPSSAVQGEQGRPRLSLVKPLPDAGADPRASVVTSPPATPAIPSANGSPATPGSLGQLLPIDRPAPGLPAAIVEIRGARAVPPKSSTAAPQAPAVTVAPIAPAVTAAPIAPAVTAPPKPAAPEAAIAAPAEARPQAVAPEASVAAPAEAKAQPAVPAPVATPTPQTPKPRIATETPARPARPAAPAVAAAVEPRSHADTWALLISCGIPIAISIVGWQYYSAPMGVKLRHPLNGLLKSSQSLGLWMGIIGLALFLFLWAYPFRKKVKALAWTGPVGEWMRVHVVAGLAIPLIVAVHAGWRFDGFIGIGYMSMLIVTLSGIVGRYLYIHIPRGQNGLEMSLEEVGNERRSLIARIAAASGLEPEEVEKRMAVDMQPYKGLDPLRSMVRMVRDDFTRWKSLQSLEHELRRRRPNHEALRGHALRETMRLARREMALAQQVRMLNVTQVVFGYWHVAHRPFAITALVAILIHVVSALVIGVVAR
jgi:hypothetical protein